MADVKVIRIKEFEAEFPMAGPGGGPQVNMKVQDLASRFRAGAQLTREEVELLVSEALTPRLSNGDCLGC